jgi:hypothetical protein
MTTRDVEWTPCGRGEESYACSGCQCGLETRQVAQLRAEVERLRAALYRIADLTLDQLREGPKIALDALERAKDR